MVQCQKCGQINAAGSNFCRACGNNFAAAPPNGDSYSYESSPRQPYSWKTDEFQTVKPKVRQVEPIGNVQPLLNRTPPQPQFAAQPPNFAAPLGYQQSHPLAQNYRCPRCASQYLPIVERKISTAGWIVFAALLITFFPLFWVGFLIKEDVKVCPVCHTRVG